jgi:PAS domain S-box-containing protein
MQEFTFEYPCHSPLEQRWFALRVTRFADAHPVRTLVAHEDITARKLAEAKLRESEERLRLALEAARLGTFDWDLLHDQIVWSRWHEEIFGFAPGEFGGTYASFAERVHPEDLAEVNEEVARCIASRQPFVREFRVLWPDASVHWVSARGEFSFAADGTASRMHGVVLETTAHREAEQKVRANEELFRALIENGSDLIRVLDARGIIRFQSPSSERLLGFRADEMIDRPIIDWLHPDDVPRMQAAIERAVKDPEVPVVLESRVRHANGQWRTMESIGRNMPGEGRDGLIVVNCCLPSNCGNPRKWRRSVSWQEGWRMTSTTSFPSS